ncbi:MAG: hypothetical protein JJU46_07960 [Balneolaceae bacterium]|nr:hypothetical protein [Balneolaceae bacterium]MCH8548459.1 putative porin [Balneolaceae bacterium]
MIVLFAIWTVFSVSVQDTIPPALPDSLLPVLPLEFPGDTIPQVAVPDTIPADTTRIEEEPEEERVDTVHVWNYSFSENFHTGETDSTLRWVNQVNLFDRFHRESGAITYRLGSLGRTDAVEHHAYETRHMNLEMEGMRLNSPLTGLANWNRMPARKINHFAETDYGATYRTRTRLLDYYLIQPRTYLNFDEGNFNYRNLDFVYTENIRKRTNIELSFWDRRDGGGYQRSETDGRQAAFRLYHQLNHQWLLRALYLNNAMDRQEPFGYAVQGDNPAQFGFNRFVETPNAGAAESNHTSSDIYLQAHYRSNIDRDVQTELGIHYQTDRWDLTYTADTLNTNFNRAELYARQHLGVGPAALTTTGRAYYLFEREGRNLTELNWLGAIAEADFSLRLGPRIGISANAMAEFISDSRLTTELSARLRLNPVSRMRLSLFGGVLSQAPDIQSLYWVSEEFAGNSSLQNEETLTGGAEARFGLSQSWEIGVRGDVRFTDNAVFVDQENNFVNIDSYSQISTTGWLSLDSRIFEGEVSATYKQYMSDSDAFTNRALDTSGDRAWIKGHLYWKNYLFDRATFVTAGFSGVFSPNPFRTAEYLTPLDRWQHGTNLNRFQAASGDPGTFAFYNPSYYRVDLDVSARIRWFMLLLKWENIFDRVNQLGYFETTGYPMPERRFMLGLRVLFTN